MNKLNGDINTYVGEGLKVVPLVGKSPRLKDWPNVEFSAQDFDKADSIGVQMGPTSGIIDFEYDSDEQLAKIYELFAGYEFLLDVCPAFTSKHGGHFLFKWNDRLEATNAGKLYVPCVNEKLIVRLGAVGKGSQSAFPPSPNKTWLEGRSILDVNAPQLPDEVIERLLEYKRPPEFELGEEPNTEATPEQIDQCREALSRLPNAIDGAAGHDATLHAACEIRRHRIYGEAGYGLLQWFNENKCQPSWEDYELKHKWEEAKKFEPSAEAEFAIESSESPATISISTPNRVFRCTDLGNGERFASQHSAVARYVGAWGVWLTYDGARWVEDANGAVVRLAKRTVRSIYGEANRADDAEQRAKIAKWGTKSESSERISAMLKMAQSEPALASDPRAFDSHPYFLNCSNGTVNLETCELLSHDSSHYLTKSTGVDYPTSDEDCPLWREFLNTIFAGDGELFGFVQRLLGYALVGQVSEHILAVLHGSGANGKSTLCETVKAAFGDYAWKAPQNLLMARRNEPHPTEIADLQGRRFVVITETERGKKLNESLVKEVTGGDTLAARRMRQDFFQFEPSHTCMMATNHRPTVEGTDLGIWRRLRLIPFAVTIPVSKQDRELTQKLRGELPAVLRWMVDGCLAWQSEGLNAPESVLLATEDYRNDSDSFRAWWTKVVEVSPNSEVRSADALASYQSWCSANDELSVHHTAFGRRVKEMDGVTTKRSNGTVYVGMKLNEANRLDEFIGA